MKTFTFILLFSFYCFSCVLAFDKFNEDCLSEHNKYRKIHGVPPLVLDQKLIDFAQNWSNTLANENKFHHRPNNAYGENLYAAYGFEITGDKAVDSWYSEIKDYDYSKPAFKSGTGHFTQVVWKNSKRVGCAIAKGNPFSYVTANYDPPGNYAGEFAENVTPPKK